MTPPADDLDAVRVSAVALSGLTDTVYLGDAIREWTDALRANQVLTAESIVLQREALDHAQSALAFQRKVLSDAMEAADDGHE